MSNRRSHKKHTAGASRAAILLSAAGVLSACAAGPEGQFITEVVPLQTALNDQKTQSMLRVADSVNQQGDTDSAIAIYGRILHDKPQSSQANASVGQVLLARGDSMQALEFFRKALDLEPTAASYVGAGQALLEKNEPVTAKGYFEKALELEPENVTALNGLGVAMDSVGDHAQAQEVYQRALKISPENKPVRNNYGLSLALSKNHAGALAVLGPLANENSDFGRKARQNLVVSYTISGDLESAVRLARVDVKNDEDIRNDLRVFSMIR